MRMICVRRDPETGKPVACDQASGAVLGEVLMCSGYIGKLTDALDDLYRRWQRGSGFLDEKLCALLKELGVIGEQDGEPDG